MAINTSTPTVGKTFHFATDLGDNYTGAKSGKVIKITSNGNRALVEMRDQTRRWVYRSGYTLRVWDSKVGFSRDFEWIMEGQD